MDPIDGVPMVLPMGGDLMQYEVLALCQEVTQLRQDVMVLAQNIKILAEGLGALGHAGEIITRSMIEIEDRLNKLERN